jgi:tetratricopeptide (TPR) repeat protein
VLQQVLEHDPEPPSRSNVDISRDVDAICAVALAKDPQRRYLNARAFAEDLERALSGQPVLARSPNALERLAIQARRHPMVASLAGALVLILITTTVVVLRYNFALQVRTDQAELARRSSDASLGFLQELLELSDVEELGPDTPARVLLEEGAARVSDPDRWAGDESLVRPRLARILGALSWGAGELEAASDLLETGKELLQGPPPKGTALEAWLLERARTGNYLGNVLRARGMDRDSTVAYRDALSESTGVTGADARELEATIAANLADLLGRLGELDEALRLARRALELSTGENDEALANRAWGLIALARLQLRANQLDEADQSLDEARKIARRMSGRPLQEAMVLDAAAMVAAVAGNDQRAAELRSEHLAVLVRTVGSQAPIVAEAMVSYGDTLRRLGDLARAAESYESGLAILEVEAPAHPRLLHAELGLGFIAGDQGSDEGVLRHMGRVATILAAGGTSGDSLVDLQAQAVLAGAVARQQDATRAQVVLGEAWVALDEQLREMPAFQAERELAAARIEEAGGNRTRALELAEEALRLATLVDPDGPLAQRARAAIAGL